MFFFWFLVFRFFQLQKLRPKQREDCPASPFPDSILGDNLNVVHVGRLGVNLTSELKIERVFFKSIFRMTLIACAYSKCNYDILNINKLR